MSYSKTAQKTLPFFGKCLIFTVLCWNLVPWMPVSLPGFTAAETGILTSLILAFLPVRVSSLSFLAVTELAVSWLLYDLLYGAARLFRLHGWFLRATLDGGIVPIVWFLYLFSGVMRAGRVVSTRYRIPTVHPLDGGHLRILQLSDIHPGRMHTRRFLKRLRERMECAEPDILVLTGDIFDEFTHPVKFRAYCGLFEEIRPKYGTWYVFGNHDADWHWHRPAHTKEDIRRALAEAGVQILEDECAYLRTDSGTIRIVGRRTGMEDRLPPEKLLGERFDGLTILLCHEPVELTACAGAGADVILAGHTHGGQIFPLGRLMKLTRIHEMHAGIREILPGRYAVVSRGVGTWGYPVRTEGKSELVILDIERIV